MTLDAAKSWSAYTRAEFMKGRLLLTGASSGYSGLRNEFSAALMVLMGMVGLILVIACANVANLLIARGLIRQKEIALRLSLGASPSQLVRQLLVEGLVLSFAGGLIGLAVAFYLTRGLLTLLPEQTQPLLLSPLPDLRILAFTFGLTLITGVVFGLLPALRASRPDPWTTLRDTAGSIAGSGGSLFLRKGLVTAQVALSFLLLFGAGLFVNSLQNLKAANTGVQLDNLITFQLAPALSGYDDDRATVFYRNLRERLAALPGVQSASLAEQPILAGDEWDATMAVEGHEAKDGEDMQAFMNAVSPGYFQTLKTPIIEGRDFSEADARKDQGSSTIPGVAIVNRRFADHFFPGKSAIGKHLGFGEGPGAKLPIEIVGLTADSLYEGPREGVRRQVFIPSWGKHSAAFYVRTTTPSNSAFTMVRNEGRSIDASIPVYGLKTVEGQLDETLLTDRLVARLSAAFGVVATLLATIGLYGVMAFVVVRRRKELGIRLALGARPGDVAGLVMREVLALLTIGLAVGLPAALGLGRYISSQLYGVQAHDPGIAVMTVALLSAVSVAAGFIPARRAGRIDPIMALRCE
jgi:predicted permease